MRVRAASLVLVVLAFLAGLAPACAGDGSAVGVVLVHGLRGSPYRIIAGLAATLGSAGYLVEKPEMCWSQSRVYDRTFSECLRDIDDAVARLKSRGAAAIVIAGMSIGGIAALAYGATHDGLEGIIVLAPAHASELLRRVPAIDRSVVKAQAMVAAGHGDERADFADVDGAVWTTARIYLSFLGPQSPDSMPDNAARLHEPLLWVAGSDDPSQRMGPGYALAKAPANPLNRYVIVKSDHLGTPDAAGDAVLAWLKELGGPAKR
jgi:pimeloyl-ACP methyl ester carboxylesterase